MSVDNYDFVLEGGTCSLKISARKHRSRDRRRNAGSTSSSRPGRMIDRPGRREAASGAWMDQESRSTLTTLNRGARSTWISTRPGSKRAKVRHGFCVHWNIVFNHNPHVVPIAEETLSHRLYRLRLIPHCRLFRRLQPFIWLCEPHFRTRLARTYR